MAAGEAAEQERLMQHSGAVPFGEGVEDIAISDIQAELGRKLEKDKQDETNRQQPGKAPRVSRPELSCSRPKQPGTRPLRRYLV